MEKGIESSATVWQSCGNAVANDLDMERLQLVTGQLHHCDSAQADCGGKEEKA